MIRRRRFSTKKLTELVAPEPLKDALHELVVRGELEWYELGKYRTTIKLTKLSGLDKLLREASTPLINPRPYVANKTTTWKRKRLKD